VQNDGATGLAGITVRLLNMGGQVIATTDTDENGFYLFEQLVPGEYQVIVDAYDPDLPPGLGLTTPEGYTVLLHPGEQYLDADFGFCQQLGGICDCPEFILFETERDRQVEIYRLDPSGEAINISRHPATDREPARSPDSRWVAFQSARDGRWQIYMANANGQLLQRLTHVNADTVDPQWAPDCGTLRLAYQSKERGNWDIHVLDVSTMADRRLTDSLADDVNPNWSPKDQRIAFESNRDGHWQIYIMNHDGSDQRRLITSNADDRYPVWSHDGSMLAFESNRDGRWQVYVFNLATGEVINASQGMGYEVNPAWSPDDSRIAFQSSRYGSWDILVVNADGSGLVRLTDSWQDEVVPTWSCDGTEVIFQGEIEEENWGTQTWNWELFGISADGSGTPHRLTNLWPFDGIPVWCLPENDGRRIFNRWLPWKVAF